MIELVKVLILSGGRTVIMIGVLASLFLGIGYLGIPQMLKGLSGSVNRIFEIDDWMLAHRVFMGVLFLLIACALAGTLYFVR